MIRVLFYCRIQNCNCSVYLPLFPSPPRMQSVGLALEELLVTAQKQDCLTIGIYESAKLLNVWVGAIYFGVFSLFMTQQSLTCECEHLPTTHTILIFGFPPQGSRQCGLVCPGSWQWRRCSAADPLHPAAVVLLWQRHHHPASLWCSEALPAAGSSGCQPKPGRARWPSLHAGYGMLTQYSSLLLYNWKLNCIITDYFHVVAS